ncbi:hypothetical protein RIF29_18098 [Crotalaria pallida]|uniref:Uncharacterized protein n=1 Tax=Crotalaria pallida TaxID=3830 RepID=A0AAN9FJS2_CROPI
MLLSSAACNNIVGCTFPKLPLCNSLSLSMAAISSFSPSSSLTSLSLLFCPVSSLLSQNHSLPLPNPFSL